MRLIDAEELMEHVYRDKLDSRELIANMVKNAPTIEERKTGKWIHENKNFFCKHIVRCSECGNYLDLDGVNAGRGNANYCPNCGADMRGKEDE